MVQTGECMYEYGMVYNKVVFINETDVYMKFVVSSLSLRSYFLVIFINLVIVKYTLLSYISRWITASVSSARNIYNLIIINKQLRID